ncbi:unnamed protein product [Lymnaea stagnalis]|uniref:Uncharacterized protein n=1 Tax=Lymnaea stagnalis TaxID=6523 RepID=A0AAV2I4I0_LYMST
MNSLAGTFLNITYIKRILFKFINVYNAGRIGPGFLTTQVILMIRPSQLTSYLYGTRMTSHLYSTRRTRHLYGSRMTSHLYGTRMTNHLYGIRMTSHLYGNSVGRYQESPESSSRPAETT